VKIGSVIALGIYTACVLRTIRYIPCVLKNHDKRKKWKIEFENMQRVLRVIQQVTERPLFLWTHAVYRGMRAHTPQLRFYR